MSESLKTVRENSLISLIFTNFQENIGFVEMKQKKVLTSQLQTHLLRKLVNSSTFCDRNKLQLRESAAELVMFCNAQVSDIEPSQGLWRGKSVCVAQRSLNSERKSHEAPRLIMKLDTF